MANAWTRFRAAPGRATARAEGTRTWMITSFLLAAGCGGAAAQEGIILEITTTSAEEQFPAAAALGAQVGSENLDDMMQALGKAGHALDQKLNGALTKAVGEDALEKLGSALRGQSPDLSGMDYTVYLRDDLMAVAAKGMPVMVWDVTDPGMSKMWFLDPTTGRPITLPGTGRPGVRLGDAEAMAVDERMLTSEIVPTGATREILGYTAHEYTYKVSLIRKMRGVGPDFAVHIEGEAWVAPTSPFREEVAAFYRKFGRGIGEPGSPGQTGHLGGLSAHMAALAELGVPLRNSESITTLLIETGADGNPTGGNVPVSKASSTSIVKSLSRAPIGDERFYGAGPGAGRQ